MSGESDYLSPSPVLIANNLLHRARYSLLYIPPSIFVASCCRRLVFPHLDRLADSSYSILIPLNLVLAFRLPHIPPFLSFLSFSLPHSPQYVAISCVSAP